MKNQDRKQYEDDDGRTVSNMNVDGMPWYNKHRAEKKKTEQADKNTVDGVYLSGSEKRAMMGGVFAAALLVAGVFALVFFLFILFCTKVWLS
ncbi:MAG: hypothetical protein IKK83_02405 [Clostridia bacterium]|nr:hypothetical protein [Clostridia bacterium]